MNIRTALAQGTELLARDNVNEPRLTAEVLLGHAMHRERSYFHAHPEQELREVEWLHYGRYLHQRMEGKPTQYITKKQEFYGRDFRVTKDVLIPRPETELLVETVLKLRARPGTLIDVGTGSGAIAITLSLEAARQTEGPVVTRYLATDLSSEALTVAKSNAHDLGADIHFVQADLLTAMGDATANVIVSNPPYVPLGDLESVQREVRDYEPHLALFAGPSGMSVYERLIPEAQRVLKPGGLLALELGFRLADRVGVLVAGWRNIQIFPDLAGIPRVLVCEKS